MENQKDAKKTERKKREMNNLLFTQIVICLLVLIVFLFMRLIDATVYSGLKNEYDKYFDKDIPLSVLAGDIGKYINGKDKTKEDEKKESEPNAEDTVLVDATTENSTVTKTDEKEIGDEGEQTQTTAKSAIKSVAVEMQPTDTGNISKAISSINEMAIPVNGRISSHFGYRTSPITGEYCLHDGMDIAAPEGTEIKAALDGTIIASVEDEEIGYYIKIDHGAGVVTAYGHCSKLIAKKGDKVKKGDVIALVGSTGRSTGPHTHFEIRINGTKINPAFVLDTSKLREN